LTPIAILLTHAHFDHIGAVEQLRERFSIDVYLHEAEKEWLSNPKLNTSALFLGEQNKIQVSKPDKLIKTGYCQIDYFKFEIVHTPGHTPGSVTFIFHKYKFIISGDILFKKGLGKTSSKDSSFKQLITSIFQQIYTLGDE